MSSQKLKKYLAYYQKTLRDDPGNIEARLRLASIFREMGRPGHAIEEYVTAAKLLASSGLPLEAIAACKAILELDPSHTETQFFLARLFAQVPEATGQLARVARPVDEGRTIRADEEPSQPAAPRVQALSERDARNVQTGKERAITLHSPKAITESLSVDALARGLVEPVQEFEVDDAVELDDGDFLAQVDLDSEPSQTESGELEAATRVVDVQDEESLQALRETLDIDGEELIDESWTFSDPEDITVTMSRPVGLDEATGVDEEQGRAPMGDANVAGPHEQTFELGIFDIASLELERDGDQRWRSLSFLGDLDESEGSESGSSETSALMRLPTERAIQSVSRSKMPEIPLLSQLTAESFMELLRVIDLRCVPSGTILLSPDDVNVSLFVIVKGRTRVTKTLYDGRVIDLAMLSEGEFFGEFRLLTGRDSLATVVADTDVELLEIRDEVLYRLADTNPEVWDALWNFYYARMLNNLLASSRMFNSLDGESREALAEKFQLEEFLAGTTILEQDGPCPGVYLIVSGNVVVDHAVGKKSREIDAFQEGDFFGIVPSALEEVCPASVRALSDTIVLRLPAEDFRITMHRFAAIDREVRRVVRDRLSRTGQYARGTTSYAELGVVKKV